jgi:hypothetical protein
MDLTIAIAVTAHLGLAGDYNAVHPHIRLSQGHVIAGAYLNSESRISLYAGLRGQRGRWFIEGGAVTGYTGADVSPYLRAGYDAGRVTVFVAPAYEYAPAARIGAVIGLEYRF